MFVGDLTRLVSGFDAHSGSDVEPRVKVLKHIDGAYLLVYEGRPGGVDIEAAGLLVEDFSPLGRGLVEIHAKSEQAQSEEHIVELSEKEKADLENSRLKDRILALADTLKRGMNNKHTRLEWTIIIKDIENKRLEEEHCTLEAYRDMLDEKEVSLVVRILEAEGCVVGE